MKGIEKTDLELQRRSKQNMDKSQTKEPTKFAEPTQLADPTVYYAIDNEDIEYVEYIENVIGMLHYHLNNSKLCVADCVSEEDGVVPVIAAIVETDGKSGILPLAKIFDIDEDASSKFTPIAGAMA
jgi:hypothetical protein